jgi:predicted DNA-binding protein
MTAEKMIEAISIKLPTSTRTQLAALAEADGLNVSEYIRVLIDRDIDAHRQKFAALAAIFGTSAPAHKE